MKAIKLRNLTKIITRTLFTKEDSTPIGTDQNQARWKQQVGGHQQQTHAMNSQQAKYAPTNANHQYRQRSQRMHDVPTNSNYQDRQQSQQMHDVPTNSDYQYWQQSQQMYDVPTNSDYQYWQQSQQMHDVPTNSNNQYRQQSQQMHDVPTNSDYQYWQQSQQMHDVPTNSNYRYTQQSQQMHDVPTNSNYRYTQQSQQMHDVPTNSNYQYRQQSQQMHDVPTNSNYRYTQQSQQMHDVPTNSNYQYRQQSQQMHGVPTNSNYRYTQQSQKMHDVPTNSNYQYRQQSQQMHDVPTNSNNQYRQQSQQMHDVPTNSDYQYRQQSQQMHGVPTNFNHQNMQRTKPTILSPWIMKGQDLIYQGSQLGQSGKEDINKTKAPVTAVPDVDAGQPPEYEDLFKQPQKPKKEKYKTPNNCQKSEAATQNKAADRSLRGRGPKDVEALNDLIRKEFGSVGGSTQMLNIDMTDKSFAGRNRLSISNLPSKITREDINELMSPFGDTVIDSYNNKKHFGFVRLKHREQAENAQRALDGYVYKGRTLQVQFASQNASFKVRNLSPYVTNELLKKAFSSFGEVERAEIIVYNGTPTGEGYLEFADKRTGEMASAACEKSCFILTKSLRPVILEEVDPDSEQRGYGEKQLQEKDAEYEKVRDVGPRFLSEGSSEYACALLWKNFYERRRCHEEKLANKFKLDEENLNKTVESLMDKVKNVKLG